MAEWTDLELKYDGKGAIVTVDDTQIIAWMSGYDGDPQAEAFGHLFAAAPDLLAALKELDQWAKAYPLNAFPEPDFKKAAEVLKANGMTLGAISASNFRHVLNGVMRIVGAALAKAEGK